jgi:membrane dipeptidase
MVTLDGDATMIIPDLLSRIGVIAFSSTLLVMAELAFPATASMTDEEMISTARGIHQRVMTLDTHVDIPFNFASDAHDPANANAQVNLDKMENGGLDAAFFIVYVGQGPRNDAGYSQALEGALAKFDGIHRMAAMYPQRIGLASVADEVDNLRSAGSLIALIGIENGYVIGRDLSLIEEFRRRGARYMTLVHSGHNDIGDSALPRFDLGDRPEEFGGLSEFGFRVVEELNRTGILVDVSHVSKKTMMDATRHSRVPVIASHSGVRAVADHPRNMDDEQLMLLKENGGVIQLVAFDSYVKLVPPEKTGAIQALQREMGLSGPSQVAALSADDRAKYEAGLASIHERWPAATVADFVDHLDHAVSIVGIEHVGISSDFDGGGGVVGWQDANETFNVTLEMVKRGYTEAQIAMIWGQNVLRIMRQAEEFATFP